jgi:integrase
VYGIIACYGLRNHEVFHVDPDSLQKSPGLLKVTEGKTDERVVFPVYPGWWKKWKLWEVKFPPVTGKNNRDLGSRVSQFFGRNELGQAYNLRHAWAIRSMLFGMDVSMAAAQMGHSVKLHCETYYQWITEEQQMKAFKILMERAERPIAPE